MTPGLTGLWQISGRSDIQDFDEVVKLDLKYIDNWSLTEDFKILISTVEKELVDVIRVYYWILTPSLSYRSSIYFQGL